MSWLFVPLLLLTAGLQLQLAAWVAEEWVELRRTRRARRAQEIADAWERS